MTAPAVPKPKLHKINTQTRSAKAHLLNKFTGIPLQGLEQQSTVCLLVSEAAQYNYLFLSGQTLGTLLFIFHRSSR
jgi:hypothetical protein